MCLAVSMPRSLSPSLRGHPAGAVPAGPAGGEGGREEARAAGSAMSPKSQARVPGTPGDRAAVHRAGLPFHSLLRLFDSAGLRDPQGEPAEDVVDDRMGVADLVRRPARRLEAGQGEAVDVGRERHGALQAERDAHRQGVEQPAR